jgi:hypothetical protein
MVPYVQVGDLASAIEKATQLGATVLQPPAEGPAGTYRPIRDPGSAIFALPAEVMTSGPVSGLQGRDDIVVDAPSRILWELIADSHTPADDHEGLACHLALLSSRDQTTIAAAFKAC